AARRGGRATPTLTRSSGVGPSKLPFPSLKRHPPVRLREHDPLAERGRRPVRLRGLRRRDALLDRRRAAASTSSSSETYGWSPGASAVPPWPGTYTGAPRSSSARTLAPSRVGIAST